MSAVAENIKPMPTAKQARPMEVLIKGKIDASRKYESKHYTRLITPASDAYSRPQIVEVRSATKLGQRDEEVTVTCKLGGFTRKPYRYTDKETGETLMVTPVDLTLDAIDA